MNFDTIINNATCVTNTDLYLTNLVYYSHFPMIGISLLFAFFVFLKNRHSLEAKTLLGITFFFSLWLAFDFTLWISANTSFLMFAWSILGIFDILFFVLSFYFVYVYLNKNDLPLYSKILLTLVSLPIIILTPTNLNLSQFDLTNCVPIKSEVTSNLMFVFGLIILFSVTIYLFIKFRECTIKNFKNQILLLSAGIISFLTSFFVFAFLSDYLYNNGNEFAYQVEQLGILTMSVFLSYLTYLIVKFKAFNIKMLATQALLVAQFALIASIFSFASSTTNRILTAITLVITTIAGYFLVKSIKKEVQQREQIEELVVTLDKANERLKILDKMKSEFVSIASHQLRSPLTSIRGYASMIAEGSYGKIPTKATEALNNIVDSAKFMALSIEDYLNVSRIEAGNMKYELSDFNVREVTEKIVDEMRPTAMKKGLVMVFRSDCNGSCTINADIGKTRQVIMNLLDNSMKYTPKGTITIVAHDDIKAMKMYVTITDTGVGMSKETQEEVFDKFVRAKNANEINVTGTGLGLFVAKKMITEMKGRVWAESEGEGKGSTFNIEFPLLPGNVGR